MTMSPELEDRKPQDHLTPLSSADLSESISHLAVIHAPGARLSPGHQTAGVPVKPARYQDIAPKKKRKTTQNTYGDL